MVYTNKYNLPESWVQAVKKNTYDLEKTDMNRISATILRDAPRIRMLRLRHDKEITEDVSEGVWKLFGNAIHYVIEQTAHDNVLAETRLEEEVNGKIVSGKPDRYENGVVQEFKITSVWKIVKDDLHEWEQQLNIYAWLLHMSGFEVSKLLAVPILKDWTRSRVDGNNYPEIPIAPREIPLWDVKAQYRYIENRVELHTRAESLADDELLPCTPQEKWQENDVWAVMKDGRKRAVKLFDNEMEANNYIKDKKGFYITYRPGSCKRCKDYCSVNKFCSEYKDE